MLEEKMSPYNIYINPTEESHRQQIWDITYNWRYDNHMVNDVYGQYESIFEFRCPGYTYRLEFLSNEEDSIYNFKVKFTHPPHKMFEDLIAIPQYSFSVIFNEDGNIKEMYMKNIRPSNVPIYPKDPVWKLFTTAYELFDKEPELFKEESPHEKIRSELVTLKGSRNFNFGDSGLIYYLIFNKFAFHHGYVSDGTRIIFHELMHNDGSIEIKKTSETTIDIIVYNYNRSDILGSLSIEFDSNGDIACYYIPCDNGDLSAIPKIKDNITDETYEFIKEDKYALGFFEAIYTIINNRVDRLDDY